MPTNTSEQFVLDLCRRSVLSLWCYNNPRGKEAGKELCDILVVCDPHVIVISVKDVLFKETDDPAVDFERWERKAVDASIKQIYGAERWLASASHVLRSDGSPGLTLPPLTHRKVHRIAVAFGGRNQVPLGSGDPGKGFVHVMNEDSCTAILNELDTITDLTEYLLATEACAARGCAIVMEGSEADLLGLYLHNGRSFPPGHDMMLLQPGIWDEIRGKPEWQRRKDADRESYYWDRLIELLSDPTAKPVGEAGVQLTSFEVALRAMARECRFSRRGLGRGVREFFEEARAGKLRSRIVRGLSGILYVFVYFGSGEDHEYRTAELTARCLIARHRHGQGDAVVGVGISKHIEGLGTASDLVYVDVRAWSAADDARAAAMASDFGFFRSPVTKQTCEEEYPQPDAADRGGEGCAP